MVRTGRLRTSDRRTRLLGRGAKQCGEHVPESFTALFTARDGGVPVGSAAGCGPFPTCYRSHKLLGRLRGHGRDLERRQFSPVKTEVISNRLKDRVLASKDRSFYRRRSRRERCTKIHKRKAKKNRDSYGGRMLLLTPQGSGAHEPRHTLRQPRLFQISTSDSC